MPNVLAPVAQDILNSKLIELFSVDDREMLTKLVQSDGEDPSKKLQIGINLPSNTSRWNPDASFTVALRSGDAEIDETTGDVYRVNTLGFSFSWGSHTNEHSCDTVKARNLIDAYTNAASLCELLTDKYGAQTFKSFVRSAQTEAERKLAVELAAITAKVKILAEHAVKGLRVGGRNREVNKAVFAGIPNGRYEVLYYNNHDSKKYTVRISDHSVYLTRIA